MHPLAIWYIFPIDNKVFWVLKKQKIFGFYRWLEQYGELVINNDAYTCTINFLRVGNYLSLTCDLPCEREIIRAKV